MKAKEIHKWSVEELGVEEDRLRQKVYEMRSQAVTEKLENPRQIRALRKDLARVLTERSVRQQKGKA